jgi:hypothetical protein
MALPIPGIRPTTRGHISGRLIASGLAAAVFIGDQVQQVRHGNGRPVARVYGPRDLRDRGANVALDIFDLSGAPGDCWCIESMANEQELSVRSGCHCNPGAREVALCYPRAQLAECFKNKDQRVLRSSRQRRMAARTASFACRLRTLVSANGDRA